MRLTSFGFQSLAFYAVILGAFFLTPYSNPFFLLLGFLTGLGSVAFFAARRNLGGVDITVDAVDPVPNGQAIRIPAHLTCKSRLRFGVTAVLELESGERLRGRVNLLDGSAKIFLQGEDLPRGRYIARRLWLESDHPGGIFRARRAVPTQAEILVYPAPLGFAEERSTTEALGDLLGSTETGAGDLNPAGLRDHRDEDGVRNIHWRASARRGRLVVQEWEAGVSQGLEVLLDRRCTLEDLEYALSTISAMVLHGRSNKEVLRIYSQDLCASFGEGQQAWQEALRFLAEADALATNAPAPPSASPAVTRLPNPARTNSHV